MKNIFKASCGKNIQHVHTLVTPHSHSHSYVRSKREENDVSM